MKGLSLIKIILYANAVLLFLYKLLSILMCVLQVVSMETINVLLEI